MALFTQESLDRQAYRANIDFKKLAIPEKEIVGISPVVIENVTQTIKALLPDANVEYNESDKKHYWTIGKYNLTTYLAFDKSTNRVKYMVSMYEGKKRPSASGAKLFAEEVKKAITTDTIPLPTPLQIDITKEPKEIHVDDDIRPEFPSPNDIRKDGLPANVYLYKGHGSDICDSTGNVITDIVPEGCVYITRAFCGLTTFYNKYDSIGLLNLGETKLPDNFFELPFTDEKRAILARAIKVDEDELHVHNPGDEYVVSSFLPISNWYDSVYKGMSISGFIALNKLGCGIPSFDFNPVRERAKLSHARLLSYFCASIYPTVDQVKSLLSKYPDPIPYSQLTRLGYDIVRELSPAENKITNTFLMRQFPGIHVNSVCRVVDNSCMTSAQSRRAVSRSRYGTKRAGRKLHKTRRNRI